MADDRNKSPSNLAARWIIGAIAAVLFVMLVVWISRTFLDSEAGIEMHEDVDAVVNQAADPESTE